MPTRAQLESALFNADAAGDYAGAKQLANALKSYQESEDPIDPQKELAAEYSAPERFVIGAGRSVAATGQGIKQLGLKAGEAMGFVEPEDVELYRQQIAEEKALYERGVGGTTAAAAGEIVGSIAQAAPSILVPGAAATALSARVASAAGVGAVESGIQPVYEKEGFAGSKAKQVATGAVLAGAGTYGLDKLADIMPKNLMTKFYQKAQEKGDQSIDEADVLEAVTGIAITPAEKAQSKSLQMLENVARQSIFAADELAAYDKKVARQGVASVNRLLRQITRPRKGAETVGMELQRAARDAAEGAINTRRSMASRDYGAIDEAAGGKPIVSLDNFSNELKEIISDFSGVEGSDAAKVVSQAKNLLKKNQKTIKAVKTPGISPEGMLVAREDIVENIPKTVRQAINSRSFYGKASAGTGNVFKDISPNLDRQMAGRLHSALTKDLIDGELDPAIGQLFKTANDNYLANSQSIKAIEMSPLGRILGKEFDDVVGAIDAGTFNSISGERAVKKIMTLDPSEIRQTMKALDKINPETADTLRAFVLRDALDNSLLPPSAGMKKGSMSFNKFQTNLEKNNIGAYGLSSKDASQLKNITSAMGRIGDKEGFNFSGTQVQSNLMNVGDKFASAMMGNAQKGAALVLEAVGLKRIAKAMTTKEGRKALETIVKPYQGKTKLDRALRTIERLTMATSAQEAGEQIGEK